MPYSIAVLFLLLYLLMCQILPLKADIKIQTMPSKLCIVSEKHCFLSATYSKRNDSGIKD